MVDTVDMTYTVHMFYTDIVYTVDMVYTIDMVYTVDTVDTVYTVQIALHCLNSSMCAYILLRKVRKLVAWEWVLWAKFWMGDWSGLDTT